MKNLSNSFSLKAILSLVSFFLILSISLPSCDVTKNTTRTKTNPGHLDPVIAKNTNPKDTVKTGSYTPVTTIEEKPITSRTDTITWCDTIQKSPAQRIVICFTKVGNQALQSDTVAVINLNDDAIYTATEIDSTIEHKLAYQVAIMMPFMSTNFNPSNGKEIPIQSIKAIEFYEGVLIALDSLKAEGVNLFVNVYDTERDTAIVQNLLSQRELQEADLIIGPLFSKNLKIVAEFAKTEKKLLISPLNPRSDLTVNNPYFIQVNPSFEVHSQLIIESLHKIERDRRVVRNPLEKNLLVLALGKDSSRVATLQQSYINFKNDPNAQIQTLIPSSPTIDVNKIKPLLQRDKLNIIVMPTTDEGFIYNSLREIQKLVDKVEPRRGYQIVIVGMDKWRYFSRINFEYYESLNLHFTSDYFTKSSRRTVRNFKENYKSIYGIGSREFGFKGFDIMLYFGRMINKYGVNFQAHLWKENKVYNHTKFQIEPIYEVSAPLDGNSNQTSAPILRNYENQHLNFLRFRNYQLNKVTLE
jgi:hypothetical protein